MLHNFGYTDGAIPIAALIFDAAGNLYGTTEGGGSYTNDGTVFELSPVVGGGWTETVLYSFNERDSGGYGPAAGTLVFDATGSLYGTVYNGGVYFGGTAFELTPTVGGVWTETVLYSSATRPVGPAIFDGAGNLYARLGMAALISAGRARVGTVFELTPVYPCARCSYAALR